jgi:hypothetical protein
MKCRVLRSSPRERGLAICISGIDGSGKTTLARQLLGELGAARVPARYVHVYQWYLNLIAMPLRLLYNRYVGREVLVLDRTIFDNIALVAASRRCPRWLARSVLAIVLALYPRFDYRFYLVADYPETLRRRPDTGEQRFAELAAGYDWVTASTGHTRLASDAMLFAEVLRVIAQGRRRDHRLN